MRLCAARFFRNRFVKRTSDRLQFPGFLLRRLPRRAAGRLPPRETPEKQRHAAKQTVEQRRKTLITGWSQVFHIGSFPRLFPHPKGRRGRHSRACTREAGVFYAGIQELSGVDARLVRAGMTIIICP